MSIARVGLAAVLAGGISVGIGILGQRWIEPPSGVESLTAERTVAQLQTLPELRLPDLQGQEVSSQGWAGKVVVINYWASWCPPCLREMPVFIRAQESHGDLVQVVGIAVDRPDDVRTFVADYPVNYPILIADPEAVAISKRLGNRVEGLPFTVIFDRRGRRVFSRTGEVTAAELDAEIAALIDG